MLGRTLLNRILFKLGQDLILIFLLNISTKCSRIHSFSSLPQEMEFPFQILKSHYIQPKKYPGCFPSIPSTINCSFLLILTCTANHCSEIHSLVLPFSVKAFCKYKKAKLQGGFYFSVHTLISVLESRPLKQKLQFESMSVLLITPFMCI